MDLITTAKRVEEILHDLSEEIRVSLVKICIEDAPSACVSRQISRAKQLNAKIRKEELLCDKTVLDVGKNIF